MHLESLTARKGMRKLEYALSVSKGGEPYCFDVEVSPGHAAPCKITATFYGREEELLEIIAGEITFMLEERGFMVSRALPRLGANLRKEIDRILDGLQIN